MAKTKAPPAPPPADFDEHTPPDRRDYRPHAGQPIPAWVELPLNEPVAAVFLDWAASGRVPAGSVLCEFVGTAHGYAWNTGGLRKMIAWQGHSGYKVAAYPTGARSPLGEPGSLIPPADLDPYRVAVVVKEKGRSVARFAVMSPRAGA